MFSVFNKKIEVDPISQIFSDLTLNQKMSIVNVILTIDVCDGEQGDQDKELQYLNSYVSILGVRLDKCMLYLKCILIFKNY